MIRNLGLSGDKCTVVHTHLRGPRPPHHRDLSPFSPPRFPSWRSKCRVETWTSDILKSFVDLERFAVEATEFTINHYYQVRSIVVKTQVRLTTRVTVYYSRAFIINNTVTTVISLRSQGKSSGHKSPSHRSVLLLSLLLPQSSLSSLVPLQLIRKWHRLGTPTRTKVGEDVTLPGPYTTFDLQWFIPLHLSVAR